MIALRHVHLFIKFGVTIEHNDTAETVLFNALDFLLTLATFTLWVNRYIWLRYTVGRCLFWVQQYLGEWGNDLRLMWQVTAGETGWAMGTG